MAWYDEAVFYHIYPLGLTGAPKQNDYGEPVHRLNTLIPWIDHMKEIGVSALYIGPLFESVGHGYETTDYRKLDSRLGTNEDLTAFVKKCHEAGLRVILDGVFNHTGRDFFAFRDLKEKREYSAYRDWYCNVNFWGNNEYNDGFSYENWGGYNLLVKLNQRNPAVRDYICDVIRFWVETFDIDGLRLDAADVLDFDFMKELRRTAESVKPEFWLMGEVIHGDYSRWANQNTLHSVTNYSLHKGLYSGMNDHNFFEIAHTVRRNNDMIPAHIKLYNFVDNHDVERIMTKLRNKAHFTPVHILLYTLPGIPSVYYGSEFGIEGRKERHSDDSLRPFIDLKDHREDVEKNPCTRLIAALGRIHETHRQVFAWGDYRELCLTNRQFAYARGDLIVAANNDDREAQVNVAARDGEYRGLLYGGSVTAAGGRLTITLPPNNGEIYAPVCSDSTGTMSTSESISSDERRGRKRKDISGQRFGRLTALYPTGEKKRDVCVWHCVCDCGKEKDVSITSLTCSYTTSCGCARKGLHKKNITGQTFGSLTAIAPTDKMVQGCTVWKCRCVCGNEKEIPINYLTHGTVKSCGCRPKRGNRTIDLTGQSFGRVTALYPTDKRLFHSVVWRCRCVCGNEIEASVNQLKRGTVKICDCMRKKSKVSR